MLPFTVITFGDMLRQLSGLAGPVGKC